MDPAIEAIVTAFLAGASIAELAGVYGRTQWEIEEIIRRHSQRRGQ